MKSSAHVRRSYKRAIFARACACALWCGKAVAQTSSLEPELWPLPPPVASASANKDRSGNETAEHPLRRASEHVQVGALVGVSFPRPLSVEGIIKLEKLAALGVDYGSLPQISVSGVQLSSWAVAGSARVFPFRGPFFVGLRAGRQHLTADATVTAYGYAVPLALSVDTTFLNPQLGFLWTWNPGITLGLDVGVQIPLSSQAQSSVPAPVPAIAQPFVSPTQQNLESVAKAVGQTTLPTVDLIRVGFLF
jgi:hypothetical protein